MTNIEYRVDRDQQGHLLAGHGGGHPVRSAQRHGALTARGETMTGTWHWPKLNFRRTIGLRPRTTTQHAEHYFRLMFSDQGTT